MATWSGTLAETEIIVKIFWYECSTLLGNGEWLVILFTVTISEKLIYLRLHVM